MKSLMRKWSTDSSLVYIVLGVMLQLSVLCNFCDNNIFAFAVETEPILMRKIFIMNNDVK